MDDIFSGLEAMGLGQLENLSLYEEKKNPKKVEVKKSVVTKAEEKDILYEKNYECPCCGYQFKDKTVKVGKSRMISQDIDLRPRYDICDNLKYGVVVCPLCGYASLVREFLHLSPAQAKMVKEKISTSFTGLNIKSDIYSYDDAIARHKLALVNSVVKHGKISERAYLCLVLGWLTRIKAESSISDTAKKEELSYLQKAVEGFKEAFAKETFPMAGLDETTAIYVVAAVSYEIGNYDDSLRWASDIISNRSASDRIKDRARQLKELIKEKEKDNG